MKLKTLFKKPQEIHTSKASGLTDVDLIMKFYGLADKHKLLTRTGQDGVEYASDDSGEMSFKRFPDMAWFKFEPFDYQSDSLTIFEAQ